MADFARRANWMHLIVAHLHHYTKKLRHSQNWKYTMYLPSEEDRAMATGNMYIKSGEIQKHDF